MNNSIKKSLIILSAIIFMVGCTNTGHKILLETSIDQTVEERNNQLLLLNQWQIKGKIAFLQHDKRESASLSWKKDNDNQQLDLTTYLGINVLHVDSNNGLHTVKFDGKRYQSDELDSLIYSLTQLTLPSKALSFWLKGLAYQQSDKISYNKQSKLPDELISQYDQRQWKVVYTNYQTVNNDITSTQLAKKITITQGDLTIKIAINHWEI